MKIRFIEPGNKPYAKSLKNYFVYNDTIRPPSNGALVLTTIAKQYADDTCMYSESISDIVWEDVLDADIVFISIFTFNANRGYELATYIRKNSRATIVFGGLHATLNGEETINYGDYVVLGEGDESMVQLIEVIKNKKEIDFPGILYWEKDQVVKSGTPVLPKDIDTIPNHNLLHQFKEMTRYNTIWPQVHASRGCPHQCDYCALVAAFGHSVRVRTPESVIEDIKQTIDFFHSKYKRWAKILWITDDNFFANRAWAISVLKMIIAEKIEYGFTIQARYEVGFDDEMLALLKEAGFVEIAMGIEFLEDEAFKSHNKKSSYQEILEAVKNIQKHGIRVRGLFIVGADNHAEGVGERLANFVKENDICGVLIQSMYFIPGTPVYEQYKERLIEGDWSRCMGKVVHIPERITPYALQKEIILASQKIYSFPRFLGAFFKKNRQEALLFMGEFFWQYYVRKDLKKDLKNLVGLNALTKAK